MSSESLRRSSRKRKQSIRHNAKTFLSAPHRAPRSRRSKRKLANDFIAKDDMNDGDDEDFEDEDAAFGAGVGSDEEEASASEGESEEDEDGSEAEGVSEESGSDGDSEDDMDDDEEWQESESEEEEDDAVKHWACNVCTLVNKITTRRCPACSAYPPEAIAVIQKRIAAIKAAKKKPKKAAPKKKEDNFNHQRAELMKRLAAHEATTAPRRQAFVAHHFPRNFATFVPAKVASKLDLEQRRPYVQEAPLLEQPACIKNGTMRAYQLRGLNFFRNLHANGVSGILGDEMGLGKTLQTISMFAYLKDRGESGPHLVVCPLSVLSSWLGELRRWCPALRCVRLHGNPTQRALTFREEMVLGKFDVCVTSYEMVKAEINTLTRRYKFDYLVIDEAHCIKNEETLLWGAMKRVPHTNCLLLTGTPLQNNLHELWSLLNFLMPDVFESSEVFDAAFNMNTRVVDKRLLSKVHEVLKPLMLRRTKETVEKDLPPKTETIVYVGLSEYQVFWYKRLLGVESQFVFGFDAKKRSAGSAKSHWQRLKHLFMQLRKASNHPFLIPDAEKEPYVNDERLIKASQKMVILDKLLVRLKSQGHRVLIFSLFTKMLDILEDFLRFRGYKYCRLDGGTHRARRNVDIGKFNAPGSDYFCYLISTRAGGLGINLHTADTVVHFDSDWNPQSDLQAQARSHRIGQKKPVTIYRLVSEGTVEERMVLRAQQKLYLDAMVTGRQLLENQSSDMEDEINEQELLKMLRFGAERIFSASGNLGDDDLDAVLDRSRVVPKIDLSGGDKKKKSPAESGDADAGKENDADAAAGSSSRKRPRSNAVESGDADAGKPMKKRRGAKGEAAAVKAEAADADASKNAAEAFSKYLQSDVQKNAAEFDPALLPTLVREFQGTTYVKEKKKESIILDGKRSRASRITMVDGQAVLKDNDYDMEGDGGCMPELGVLSAAQSIKHRRKKKRYLHESICFNCRDGGLIMMCNNCPKSYHPECAGYSKPPTHMFMCFSHKCSVCGVRSSTAGFMFRCAHCPHAFCEQHAPPAHYGQANMEGRVDLDSCPHMEARGYDAPKTLGWILCSLKCQEEYDENAHMPGAGAGDEKTEWDLLPPYARQVLDRELRRASQHYNWLVHQHAKATGQGQHLQQQQKPFALASSSSPFASSSSSSSTPRTPVGVAAPAAAPLSLVTPPAAPSASASRLSAAGGMRAYFSSNGVHAPNSLKTPLSKSAASASSSSPPATPTSSGDTPVPPPPPPQQGQLTPNSQVSAQHVKMEIESASSTPVKHHQHSDPVSHASFAAKKENMNPLAFARESRIPPPPPPVVVAAAAAGSSAARNGGGVLSPRIGAAAAAAVVVPQSGGAPPPPPGSLAAHFPAPASSSSSSSSSSRKVKTEAIPSALPPPSPIVPLNFASQRTCRLAAGETTSLRDVPGFLRRIGSIPARTDMIKYIDELVATTRKENHEKIAETSDEPFDRHSRDRTGDDDEGEEGDEEGRTPIKERIGEWRGIKVDVSRPIAEQRRFVAHQFTDLFDDFDAWTNPAFRLLTQLMGLKVLLPDPNAWRFKGGKAGYVKKKSGGSAKKEIVPCRKTRDCGLGEHQSRIACWVALQMMCPSVALGRVEIDYHTLQDKEQFEFGY